MEEVRKSKTNQAVIHITHDLTLRAYKLWLLLLQNYRYSYLQNIKPSVEGFCKIEREELDAIFGYRLEEPVLNELLTALSTTLIKLNYFRKDRGKVVHGIPLSSEWQITSTHVFYLLPPAIMEVMQRNEIYQLINWEIVNSFNNAPDVYLYLLCADYRNANKLASRTPNMTIQEFREYFGVKELEYLEFKDLNKYMIKGPISRINGNERCDITIEPEYIKAGRKVTGLFFNTIAKAIINRPVIEAPQPALEAPQPEDCFAGALVRISKANKAKYLQHLTPDDVKRCITVANNYLAKMKKSSKKVQSLGAVYATAFDANWGAELVEAQKVEQEKEQAKKANELRVKMSNLHAEIEAVKRMNEMNRKIGVPEIPLPKE